VSAALPHRKPAIEAAGMTPTIGISTANVSPEMRCKPGMSSVLT
jgi:hypothetical protein